MQNILSTSATVFCQLFPPFAAFSNCSYSLFLMYDILPWSVPSICAGLAKAASNRMTCSAVIPSRMTV